MWNVFVIYPSSAAYLYSELIDYKLFLKKLFPDDKNTIQVINLRKTADNINVFILLRVSFLMFITSSMITMPSSNSSWIDSSCGLLANDNAKKIQMIPWYLIVPRS